MVSMVGATASIIHDAFVVLHFRRQLTLDIELFPSRKKDYISLAWSRHGPLQKIIL